MATTTNLKDLLRREREKLSMLNKLVDECRARIDMLQALQSTRAMLRSHRASAQDLIEFAVPHTLAFR